MKTTGKGQGFLKQAGILAIAGIIVRIIGILYRSPLTSIIGDEGNGYYSTAYNIYAIILLVSSYSIPGAISKEISQLLALKEYKNAHRFFRCTVIYVAVVGGLASILTFLFSGVLVSNSNTIVVLRTFVPTIFLSGLLGVLRGYFQAHGSMVQTSVSQIFEQLFNALISVMAAYLFVQMTISESETTQAIYGAVGSAIGTGVGVLIALIFMYAVYLLNKKQIMKKVKRDRKHKVLHYNTMFKRITLTVTPFVLSTFIYNLSTSLNQEIYSRILIYLKGFSVKDVTIQYGIFSGKAVVITSIPIAIASAVSSALIPSIAGSYVKGDTEATNEKIDNAIHMLMLIAIPAAVGLAVHAQAIVQLLFPQADSLLLAAKLLRLLSITVIFYSLSTLTNAVLQGIGKPIIPVINAFMVLVLQSVVLVGLLLGTNLNLYALVIVTIIYSSLMCLLNSIAIRRQLNYKSNIMMNFGLPALASVIMGIVSLAAYKLCYMIIKSNVVALFFAILIALLAYGITLILLKVVKKEILRDLFRHNTK